MTILNFGSFCIDHVYRVPHFVRPGETLPSLSHQVFAGGKGFNQTLAIARAGVPVCHAGAVGADGLWLRHMLIAESVDASRVRVTETGTGHAVIQLDPDGNNAIVLSAGANRSITRAQIDSVLADFNAGDTLILQNEISEPEWIVERALVRGLRIIMNPAPMDAVAAELPLEKFHMVVVNEVEAADLTGEREVEAQLQALQARMPQTIAVLTLGEKGAIWQHRRERIVVDALQVPVVDTTGAGDTFTGYLVASLEQGLAPDAAMRRAVAAAGICVTRAGAADSIPRAVEVDHRI